MHYIDVVSLSLGFLTSEGVIQRVVQRNTITPTRKSRMITTTYTNQTSLQIPIYEGARPFPEFNKHLGMLVIEGLKEASKGEPRVEVVFDVDSNRLLIVRAREIGGNEREAEVRIENLAWGAQA